MQRSSSASRVSDDGPFYNSISSSSGSGSLRPSWSDTELPTLDPLSRAAERERVRKRSAENAVHAIPLLLLLCAAILWIFSYPEWEAASHVEVGMNDRMKKTLQRTARRRGRRLRGQAILFFLLREWRHWDIKARGSKVGATLGWVERAVGKPIRPLRSTSAG
ncbi:hypothetical protein SAY86_019308 [Trapa natans]|uniref:Transmembrane protein n=1 Tax=Trapa natans TaxID=22666 RepID=A0AAN7LMY4_TRANT|nr:hypothetical protein SAY86_019308 [Trapa natans]